MDIVNFTQPIDEKHADDDLEKALAQAFRQVFNDNLNEKLNDLINYGTPHLGSNTVVERFCKQEGLAILRRQDSNVETIMKVILAEWLSIPSLRGLNFLKFVLNMLWKDQWILKPLFHDFNKRAKYPQYLKEPQDNEVINGVYLRPEGTFLTSRFVLKLSDVEFNELRTLIPIVRELVPANVVLKVISEKASADFPSQKIGICMYGRFFKVFDLTK